MYSHSLKLNDPVRDLIVSLDSSYGRHSYRDGKDVETGGKSKSFPLQFSYSCAVHTLTLLTGSFCNLRLIALLASYKVNLL